MVCDKCGFYKSKGDKFCTACGQDLSDSSILPVNSDGYEVSQFYPNQPKKESAPNNFFFVAGLIAAVAASVLLLLEIVVMIWGAGEVFGNLENLVKSDNPPGLFIVVPVVVVLFEFNEAGLGIYYSLLLLALLASAGLYFYFGGKSLLKIPDDEGKSAFDSAIVEMPILFGGMFLVEVIYLFIVLGNTDIVGPISGPAYESLYSLLNASVWEEVLTRFCLIGIPMTIIFYFFKKDKFSLKCLFGGFGFSKVAVLLIVISAIVFGAAHLTNWPLWKFFPTFLFGLLAGYLFVKHGLFACIMAHFVNDYLFSESLLTGSDVPFISFTIIISLMIISIPFFYYYGKKLFNGFLSSLKSKSFL